MPPMPPWFWPVITASSAYFVGLGAMRLFLMVKPVTGLMLLLVYVPALGWGWRKHWQ